MTDDQDKRDTSVPDSDNPEQAEASEHPSLPGQSPQNASDAVDTHSPEGGPDKGEPVEEGESPSSPQRDEGDVPVEVERDMSAFEDDVEDSDLTRALAQVDQLGDELAHAKADLYNLKQEYGNYVRRSKDAAQVYRAAGQEEVISALIGVLDDIAAARAHGDLAEGPFAAIAQKLEETLSARFGLEQFGAPGDDFDPTQHEALMAQSSSEVDHPVVAQVLQPGYRMGEKVLRATKVLVENPQ